MAETNEMDGGSTMAGRCVAPILRSTSATVDNNAFRRTNTIGNHWLRSAGGWPSTATAASCPRGDEVLRVFVTFKLPSPEMLIYLVRLSNDISSRTNSASPLGFYDLLLSGAIACSRMAK